jgi:hypothetical protein
VAGHRRELALGDVARKLAQRGLIFGVGERIRTVHGHGQAGYFAA